MTYEVADRGIKAMNRENLRTFSRMKTRLMKADELHVIREVTTAYDAILGLAERWFLEIARQAYMAGMKEAGKRKRCPIDRDWILDWLEETDFVTLYRFIPEWERKKARLIEALPVAPDKGKEIDKALKEWARQIGQYAITATDKATLKAFKDAGVEMVMWHSEHDNRVCKSRHNLGVIHYTDQFVAVCINHKESQTLVRECKKCDDNNKD